MFWHSPAGNVMVSAHDISPQFDYQTDLIKITAAYPRGQWHSCDVIIGAMASEITSLAILYQTVHSGADQRKHRGSASLAFVWSIQRWPTGEFPAQRESNAKNVSIWWRQYVVHGTMHFLKQCYVDLFSAICNDIHQRTVMQEIYEPLTEYTFNVAYLTVDSNVPGANELIFVDKTKWSWWNLGMNK